MYGLIIVFAILACALVAERLAKEIGRKEDLFWGGLFWSLIGGVIGARVYHVLDYWQLYFHDFLRIFKVWQGGLGIYGGLAGGLIAGYLYLHSKGEKNFSQWFNIAGVVLPLGQAIGRWGNFFNNEIMPYALYESIANFILFAILIAVYKEVILKHKIKNRKEGFIFLLYLIGYSTIRIVLNPMRTDDWQIMGVSVAQSISIAVLYISLITLIKNLSQHKRFF